LERAVELSGEEPNVVADFAFFLAAARGPRLAEEAANEAVCANHKCAAAWAALGLAQFRRRRRRAAEASVRRALELDPNDPYALAVMLALLHERRDNARAVALAELLKDSRGTEEFVAVRLFLRNYGLPDLSGTEEFVETIQEQAKKREVAKELIERRALREPTYYDESPRLLGFALILTVLIIAALVALIVLQPSLAPVIILFGLIPLVLLWFFRRFVD
jgi:Flp pilus assembly protein TadD